MKYIKKYENSNQEYEKVCDIIAHYLKNTKLWESFSSGKYYKENYQNDINDFKTIMLGNYNIDFDLFVKKYRNRILADDFFIHNCGFLDALLYQYDKSFPLGGDDYKLTDLENYYDTCEHIIKYDYGYHFYDLGIKYILQSYDSLEDYFFACAELFYKEMFTSEFSLKYYPKWNYMINHYFDIEHNYGLFVYPIKLKKGSICFINIRKMHKLISSADYDDFFDIIVDKANFKTFTSSREDGWCARYFGTDADKKSLKNLKIDLENLDFDEIRKDVEFHIDANKYNL